MGLDLKSNIDAKEKKPSSITDVEGYKIELLEQIVQLLTAIKNK